MERIELAPGTVIEDRFEVLATIGAGVYGVVYRALDRSNDTQVALKSLSMKIGRSDTKAAGRFAREAEICAQLKHPNTANLLHFGHDATHDVPFIVFELVRGLALNRILAVRGRLEMAEVVHVLSEMCDSLFEAHEIGIIHRDLKPDNVMIKAATISLTEPTTGGTVASRLGIPEPGDGHWRSLSGLPVKVVDFGLGKVVEDRGSDNVRLTDQGVVPGTAHYISPEQIECVPDLDHRSDIYGIGLLIYRLMTGGPPFNARTAAEICMLHLTGTLPPLPGSEFDDSLEKVYRKAAARDRDARYQTAGELGDALRAIIGVAPRGRSQLKLKKRGLLARLLGR